MNAILVDEDSQPKERPSSVETFPFRVDEVQIAVDQVNVRVGGKELSNHPQRTRRDRIVRIEPAKNLSGRSRETGANRIRLPPVLGALPIRQPIHVLSDDLRAAVRRAAVHDDVLQVRVPLGEDGLDRLFKERRLVEGRGDDRDLREDHFAFFLAMQSTPAETSQGEREFRNSRQPALPGTFIS